MTPGRVEGGSRVPRWQGSPLKIYMYIYPYPLDLLVMQVSSSNSITAMSSLKSQETSFTKSYMTVYV